MAQIVVLDQHTAELIAAGEVVERPASVVKELCENAIDAGAHRITVSIERGGIACIEISDDGTGIEAEYIPTAFVRHATSKIRTGEDLEHIATLGFRGEALASVASVARVTLLTKTQQDEFASRYRICGGAEESFEAAARPVGTTITVRDLFYNTPARMKFLKKDVSEGNYISDVVTELALSHPEISFQFVRERKKQFQTPGDGSLRGAVYAAVSRDFAKDLLDVTYTAGNASVCGCVTAPRAARGSRGMQFFFVNGRYVKNRTMMAALEAAYKGTVMQGRFPGCVLTLTLPPQLVDVNVHPAKTEVRFARERDVFDLVYAAAKGALLAPGSGEQHFSFSDSNSALSSEEATAKAQPAAMAGGLAAQRTQDFGGGNAFRGAADLAADLTAANATVANPTGTNSANANPPGAVHHSFRAAQKTPGTFSAPSQTALQRDAASIRVYNEAVQTLASAPPQPYRKNSLTGGANPTDPIERIGEETADGQETPPQRATAENAPFAASSSTQEDTLAQRIAVAAALQAVPAEEPVPPEQTVLPEFETQAQPGLQYIGEVFQTYIVAQRGNDVCFIDKHAAHERILYERLAAQRAGASAQLLLCPVTIQMRAEEKNAVLQSAALLEESGVALEDFGGTSVVVRSVPADIVPEDVENLVLSLAARLAENPHESISEKTEWVLHSIACRAAVKAGDKTSAPELLRLAQQVLDGEIPPFCPHGRPVVLKVSQKELEKQFGRLG